MTSFATGTHPAFRAALRRAKRGSVAFQRVSAGLLALELLDRSWLAGSTVAPHRRRSVAARHAVAALTPRATRAALASAIESMGRAAPPRDVLQAFDRYADRLRREGAFELAADVFGMIAERARDANVLDLAARAYECLGYCQREMCHTTEAMQSYETGRATALACGEAATELRIRIAQGNLHRMTGSMAAAREVLDMAIADAVRIGLHEGHARAAHERGILAHHDEHPLDALPLYQLAFEAYTISNPQGSDQRDRLLIDIGLALTALGEYEEAQRICRALYCTAKERVTRWIAAINIMELAVLTRKKESFYQYSYVLSRVPLPARFSAEYHYHVGLGLRAFQADAEADAAFGRASQIARRLCLRDLRRRALEALAGRFVEPVRPSLTPAQRETVTHIMEVVSALGRLRGE